MPEADIESTREQQMEQDGSGFDAPCISVRLSLANLPSADSV
jgi:hypothetical protein